jgi:predicted HAD superfamily hydrolase
MLKSHEGYHDLQTYKSLGFTYGGAASLGFLKWIKTQAAAQQIDHVFFLSRDGYVMQKMVARGDVGDFPDSTYFYGSRTALTLATINDQNFIEFIPFYSLEPRGCNHVKSLSVLVSFRQHLRLWLLLDCLRKLR